MLCYTLLPRVYTQELATQERSPIMANKSHLEDKIEMEKVDLMAKQEELQSQQKENEWKLREVQVKGTFEILNLQCML